MSSDYANGESHLPNWKLGFSAVWAGQAFSLLGSSLVQFALVWWLTQTTGSATVLATATLVALLPGIFVGPFAGALVDRWNRKRVMVAADGLIALATVALIYLYGVGAMQVWHVYTAMFLRACAGAFHWPAMQASTSLMVPKQHLSRVAGLNQTLHGVTSIVSPPLGALLLSVLPLQGVLSIDVVTAGIAVASLLLVRIPQPARRTVLAGGGVTSVLADVREGLRYMWSWPGMFALLVVATLINFLLSPAFALMPILVTKHFQGGALQLGWLESSWGIGVVVGGLFLGVWGGFRRRIYTSLLGLVGISVGTLVVGFAPATVFGLALAGMFVAGVMNPITNGPIMAIVQAVVAPDMQGRVFTVIQSAAMAMSPLSMLFAGPIADVAGVRTWYIIGGVGCALIAFAAYFIPTIVHLEEGAQAEDSALGPLPVPVESGDDPARY